MTKPMTDKEADEFYIQEMMNVGYDWWQQQRHQRLGFSDAVEAQAPHVRVAMVLGKFNQQVNNGGLGQWIDNRYAQDVALQTLVDACNAILAQDRLSVAQTYATLLLECAKVARAVEDDDWEKHSLQDVETVCPECGGSGVEDEDDEVSFACNECGGDGWIMGERTVEVDWSEAFGFQLDALTTRYYALDEGDVFAIIARYLWTIDPDGAAAQTA